MSHFETLGISPVHHQSDGGILLMYVTGPLTVWGCGFRFINFHFCSLFVKDVLVFRNILMYFLTEFVGSLKQ
jgi:hypothetical protein